MNSLQNHQLKMEKKTRMINMHRVAASSKAMLVYIPKRDEQLIEKHLHNTLYSYDRKSH